MWALPTVPLFAGKSRFFTRNVPLKTFSRLAGLWLSSKLVIFARARQRGVSADGWRKLHFEHGESINRHNASTAQRNSEN